MYIITVCVNKMSPYSNSNRPCVYPITITITLVLLSV